MTVVPVLRRLGQEEGKSEASEMLSQKTNKSTLSLRHSRYCTEKKISSVLRKNNKQIKEHSFTGELGYS